MIWHRNTFQMRSVLLSAITNYVMRVGAMKHAYTVS